MTTKNPSPYAVMLDPQKVYLEELQKENYRRRGHLRLKYVFRGGRWFPPTEHTSYSFTPQQYVRMCQEVGATISKQMFT